MAYVQNRNKTKQGKKVKAIVYGVTTADDIHIVRFSTEKAMMNGAEVEGWKLLARLGGILSGLPMTRSATYSRYLMWNGRRNRRIWTRK